MPIKVCVGLSKKVGQQNYGSLGATCHVEFELDSGYDNGSTDKFQDAVRRSYAACSQAVESQLEIDGASGNTQRVGLQHVADPVNRIVDRVVPPVTESQECRMATPAQVRAIHAITNRNGVELAGLLGQFKVSRPDELSIRHASRLIDQLKNKQKGDALGSSQPS